MLWLGTVLRNYRSLVLVRPVCRNKYTKSNKDKQHPPTKKKHQTRQQENWPRTCFAVSPAQLESKNGTWDERLKKWQLFCLTTKTHYGQKQIRVYHVSWNTSYCRSTLTVRQFKCNGSQKQARSRTRKRRRLECKTVIQLGKNWNCASLKPKIKTSCTNKKNMGQVACFHYYTMASLGCFNQKSLHGVATGIH